MPKAPSVRKIPNVVSFTVRKVPDYKQDKSFSFGLFQKFAVFAVAALIIQAIHPFGANAASGTVKTVTSLCGAPVNANTQYSVGDHVYVDADGFDADTEYSWNIAPVPGSSFVSGTFTTDDSGHACFDAYTIQSGDDGVYKVTFGNKSDNYLVKAETEEVPADPASLTVTKVVIGGDKAASDFTLNATGTNISMTSFAGNASGTLLTLDAGNYAVTEISDANYTIDYSAGCSGVAEAGAKLDCIVTNTFNEEVPTPTPTTTPDTTFHFVKILCAQYSDIAGNADGDKYVDPAVGNHYMEFNNFSTSTNPVFPYPYLNKPVSLSEIPKNCKKIPGWEFKLSTDQVQSENVSVVGPTDSTGEITKTFDELPATIQTQLTDGKDVWISEVQQPEVASFAAIRCYQDAINGDNLEFVNLGSDTSVYPANVYCLAYNVGTQTTFHFIKQICPSYSVVAGNADGDKNVDPTLGSHYTEFTNYSTSTNPVFPYPYDHKPVNPAEIPEDCTGMAGWHFMIDDNSGMGTATEVGPTNSNGQVDVPLSTMPANVYNALVSGGQMWVKEAFQEGYSFAAIRCYQDAINGDNLEYITLGSDLNTYPADVYCIAYNIGSGDNNNNGGGNGGGGDNNATSGPFTLTLTKSGDGNGTVDGSVNGATSTPFCDLTQCDPSKEQSPFVQSYASGTTITLTPTPDENSNFNGTWSGDCTGTDPCTLVMTKDMTANAHFALNGGNGGGPTITTFTSGGGGGGGVPVIPEVEGTSTTKSVTPTPSPTPDGLGGSNEPAVLGATTLPRTGTSPMVVVLVLLGVAVIASKRLKLI